MAKVHAWFLTYDDDGNNELFTAVQQLSNKAMQKFGVPKGAAKAMITLAAAIALTEGIANIS